MQQSKSAALSLLSEISLTIAHKSPVWALFVEVGYDCALLVCATQGKKRAAGRPTALKKLLCHDFADGIREIVFRDVHLQSCRVGNIHRSVLIRVGSMEIDAF